jgi:outer membrane murein-binding lipoprotein Lpp
MADDENSAKVKELTAQIQALTATVEQLNARFTPPPSQPQTAAPPAPSATDETGELAEVTEEILAWAGKASLLPRISTLCFLLVVALGLRTLTDNNLINTLFGSALGMGYAAILMLVGGYWYGKASPLAPVFAACGAALMAIIVVETHARFGSLPLVPAYLTLMATGIGMAFISYRYNVFLPISIGTLGMCLAGAAIDYPHPFFPYLAMILWTANMLGFFAARLQRCSWLRWIVLLVSMMMLHLWGVQLTLPDTRHAQVPALLAVRWFLPVLAVFACTFPGLALAGIIRSGTDRIARFDYALPTINVLWAFATAYFVVHAWGSSVTFLSWVGIAFAAAHFGVAFWLAGRKAAGNSGANPFILAGATLLALALPTTTGSFTLALPALALAAFWLLVISRQWQNGGTRVISYLVQLYAAGALAIFLHTHDKAAVDAMTAIPAGLLAVAGFYHYRLARRSPPPEDAPFFAHVDRHDRSAVLMLLGALTSSFLMLRVLVYQTIVALPGDIGNSYRCAQSIIINLAATALMLIALRHRNREIRNVAILVTIVGAGHVFLHDLLRTHGVPLVLSVFTFGLAAALESITLGRWQKEPRHGEVPQPASRA